MYEISTILCNYCKKKRNITHRYAKEIKNIATFKIKIKKKYKYT